MRIEPARLVFIDETAVATNLTRRRGRSLRGERLPAEAPFGRWQTQTFIAGLRCDRLTAPWLIDGPINRVAFNIYVETQLAPTLRRGDIVILDNLSVHNSAPASEALRRAAPGFCFFPSTLPTSIRSRWHSQSSRRSCVVRRHAHSKPFGLHWAISALCSTRTNAGIISRQQPMRPIKRTML